ncbi:hypothetical protein CC78DRAFT_618554 [Lojkania enalia]|uniref:Uncharacterized protein n=1 Tax=Lojkania enalia TaxID=147567 RepID=A0A9P4KA83_9PLEO|nr:hypothetical protein CC78DRAFT_618554 [Didymosphaeria enalia]
MESEDSYVEIGSLDARRIVNAPLIPRPNSVDGYRLDAIRIGAPTRELGNRDNYTGYESWGPITIQKRFPSSFIEKDNRGLFDLEFLKNDPETWGLESTLYFCGVDAELLVNEAVDSNLIEQLKSATLNSVESYDNVDKANKDTDISNQTIVGNDPPYKMRTQYSSVNVFISLEKTAVGLNSAPTMNSVQNVLDAPRLNLQPALNPSL